MTGILWRRERLIAIGDRTQVAGIARRLAGLEPEDPEVQALLDRTDPN
jgi:hypothetical protein